MLARFPCRLHFILAREAPVGVLFRRGPSRWVQLIGWNLRDGSFQPGQWFKGRIYEKRSDLSPDGSKLIYFARKITGRSLADTSYTYAWTAISRPPYLTALALWPKGDCWNGGGLFESNTRVWLNHFEAEARPHEEHTPRGLDLSYNRGERGEDDTVLRRRLDRDGWRTLQEWKGRFVESPFAQAYEQMMKRGLSSDEMLAESLRLKLYELDTRSGYVTELPEVRHKPGPDAASVLVMEKELRAFKAIHRFAIRNAGGSRKELDAVEWADWDPLGNVAFVRAGKVFVGYQDRQGSWVEREIGDFNAHIPEPVESPNWARQW